MTEKEIKALSDARGINMIEPFLIPLLMAKKDEIVISMCTKFLSKEKDFIADVAQISFVQNFIEELKRIQTKGNNIAARIEETI